MRSRSHATCITRSARYARRHLGWRAEACGCLVALPVFKTGVAEDLGQAGSIPVRLRHLRSSHASRFGLNSASTFGNPSNRENVPASAISFVA